MFMQRRKTENKPISVGRFLFSYENTGKRLASHSHLFNFTFVRLRYMTQFRRCHSWCIVCNSYCLLLDTDWHFPECTHWFTRLKWISLIRRLRSVLFRLLLIALQFATAVQRWTRILYNTIHAKAIKMAWYSGCVANESLLLRCLPFWTLSTSKLWIDALTFR